MLHEDFVAARNAGSVEPKVDPWRACLLLERLRSVPFTIGEGYRWQRLSMMMSLACALPLLFGLPIWTTFVLLALGLVLRDWGIVVGAIFAALVLWWDEWVFVTGVLSLLTAAWYGWQAMRAAETELVRLAASDPRTYAAALERRALTLEPTPAS